MQIKRKTAFTAFVSFFIMCFCVMTAFADDTQSGRSPKDASVGIVYPAASAKTEEPEQKTVETLKRTSSLSYGMDVIRHNRKLIKTATGGKVEFALSDFQPYSEQGSVSAVTIVKTPDASSGVLKAGALDTYNGQRLSAQMAENLCFIPSGAEDHASFVFKVNGGDEETECVIYTLRRENSSPVACSAKVYTKTDISAFGRLDVTDKDGDACSIRVTKMPSHGRITINSDLSYVYTPDDGFKGKDSFSYRAVDKYGNKSEQATVSVTVEKRTNGVVYADAAGTEYEYAAVLLSEKGILTGENVAGTMRFEPEKTVSRADFIVMAMSASGYSPNLLAAQSTGLADEDKLTDIEKGYVVTAMSAGAVAADDYDGVKLIRPSSSITVGEAAEIVKALGAKVQINGKNDSDPLSRADAALMLASLVDSGR